VALIGTYTPRRCGIATFTADLRAALVAEDRGLACDVYPVSDIAGAHAYPVESCMEIAQDSREFYALAARTINASDADVVCLQHEFGIFGGEAGEHILLLLDLVRAPVVVTLHTVLREPNEGQRRVVMRLARRAAKLVVMAEKGRHILQHVYGVARERIEVIPHGAPDRPLGDTAPAKRELGLGERQTLLTFGLLSPGKGVEEMIRAMPAIAAAAPQALYVVLGATHPNLVAREGEAYRDRLVALVAELGVSDHVRFVNAYVDQADLIRYLEAADIYVTPYLNEAQITSGTLSFAVALGKPVVSTPYWHAQELLADGRGVLTPFGDPNALALACADLLTDKAKRAAISARAYSTGRATIWPQAAKRYITVFDQAVRIKRSSIVSAAVPEASIAGLARYTDEIGILQHGTLDRPDPAHGYCVDDNARALILTCRMRAMGMRRAGLDRLETKYAAFVARAWNPQTLRFRNFMSGEGVWLEEAGSDDSFGRAMWGLGVAARMAGVRSRRLWAARLAAQAMPSAIVMRSLRAVAFVILGLVELIGAGRSGDRWAAALRDGVERLMGALASGHEAGREWFEAYLSYDNARLPEALLRAGAVLRDGRITTAGLRALSWLCDVQTAPSGWFRPVASESLGKPAEEALVFDQQPLEAAATIDACIAAFNVGGDRRWITEARRAFAWYLGDNDLGEPLIAGDGLCFDGLTPRGPNLNHGAESILSLQLAILGMRELARTALALRRGSGAIPPGRRSLGKAADATI
jgi:glycosyltransferase involved in cell wall biosynthesis